MDLCQVRYFLSVCREGSFTAAAKACGVSQPSVTTGVRRLERAVGGRLFERRHPVQLTAYGAELRPLFESMQMAADHIATVIAEHQRRSRPAASGRTKDAKDASLLGRFPTPHRRTQAAPDPHASPEPAVQAMRDHSVIIRSRIAIQRANRAITNANLALGRGQQVQN